MLRNFFRKQRRAIPEMVTIYIRRGICYANWIWLSTVFQRLNNKLSLPRKSAGKEFALEKAYERFAFIKSLEKHKEQQVEYESMLRRTTEENTFEENVLHGDIVVAVDEDVSSDSDD